MPSSENRKESNTWSSRIVSKRSLSPRLASVRILSNRDENYTGVYEGLDSVTASNELISLVAMPSSSGSTRILEEWIANQNATGSSAIP